MFLIQYGTQSTTYVPTYPLKPNIIVKWTEQGIQFHFSLSHSLFMLTTLPHLSLATASKISSQAKVKLQAAPEHHKPQLFRLTMIDFDFSAVVSRMS